jgi:hypothetical protein
MKKTLIAIAAAVLMTVIPAAQAAWVVTVNYYGN